MNSDVGVRGQVIIIASGFQYANPPLTGTLIGYISRRRRNHWNSVSPLRKSSNIATFCPWYPSNQSSFLLDIQKSSLMLVASLVFPQPVSPASQITYGLTFFCDSFVNKNMSLIPFLYLQYKTGYSIAISFTDWHFSIASFRSVRSPCLVSMFPNSSYIFGVFSSCFLQ